MLAGTRGLGGERRTVRAESDEQADAWYVDEDFAVVRATVDVAREKGLPPAQVALAWLLHKPGVTAPKIGATRLGHVDDAVAAVDVELAAEEMARLEAPYRPHPVIGQ